MRTGRALSIELICTMRQMRRRGEKIVVIAHVCGTSEQSVSAYCWDITPSKAA